MNATAKRHAADLAQVAALPLMVGEDGITRVMLLTSRETKRWIIPKGWPMKGRKPYEAAAREALEEAGLVGHLEKKAIGSFGYFKRRASRFDVCRVEVYLLRVEKQLKTWREKGQRQAQWFTLDEAAALVEEPELAELFRELVRTGPPKHDPPMSKQRVRRLAPIVPHRPAPPG